MNEYDDLRLCLPAELRDVRAEITPVAAGLSGAGVYHVRTPSASFVLKITDDTQPLDVRRRRVGIQRLAGDRGVAPRVVHIDEERRAVLTMFVEDHSFGAHYGTPATHAVALEQLADTLRTVHAMDPHDAPASLMPEASLANICSRIREQGETPAFVVEAIERVRSLAPPEMNPPLVLSHNDVNPSNIMYDGARILLLDWETCGAGDPYYDLASVSVFFRMDDATCVAFLEAYDGSTLANVPQRFRYNQALVAALCGSTFFWLARTRGCTATVNREDVMTLADIYMKMRTGQFDIASPGGQWKFGLALLKASEEYAM